MEDEQDLKYTPKNSSPWNTDGVSNSTNPPRLNYTPKKGNVLHQLSNTGLTVHGYNQDIGKSSYDEGLTWNTNINENDVQGSLNEFRSNQQGGWDETGAFFGRVGLKVGTEIAKTAAAIVGTVGGIIGNTSDLITGKDDHDFLEIAFNNDFIKAAENIQKYIQSEYLPVYVSDTVTNGNFLDKVSSGEFWATEGADGVGYLISAMAPGAAFKALGGANKLFGGVIKASQYARYGEGIEGARKALTSAGMTIGKIDSYMIPAFNTYFEAGAEAKGFGDGFESRKPEFIEKFKSNLDINSKEFQVKSLEKAKEFDIKLRSGEISVDEYNKLGENLPEIVSNELAESAFLEQKGRGMRNTFLTNVGILAVPNYIQAKLVFGKNPSKVLIDKITGKAAEKSIKNTIKQGLKRTGETFLSEGSEEVAQTSTEHRNTERAVNNQLSEYAIQDANPIAFGEDFIKSLGTTEGQVAGFLGGVLGSPVAMVQGYRQDLSDRKNTERLRDKINGQSTSLKDIYNTPIYETEEYTAPETGETITRDKEVDGKKVLIPENVAKIKNALDLQGVLSERYDRAIEEGDLETLETLKKQGEFNIISNFIGEDEITLDALKEHLETIFPVSDKNEDGSAVSQDQIKQNTENKNRVSSIIDKAKILQKDLVSFKDMSQSIIRLKNDKASETQIADFLNSLGNAFISERSEEYDTKEKLKKLESERNNILKDINIETPGFFSSDYKSTEEISKIKELKELNKKNKEIDVDENGFAYLTGEELYQNNPRLNYLNEQIKKQKDKLKDFNETTNNLIWNNEYLNKQLDSKIKTDDKVRQDVSDENVEGLDNFITQINDPSLTEEKDLNKLIKDNPEYKDNPVVKAKIDQKRQEIIDTKKAIMDAAKAAKHAENIEKEETTPSNGQVPTVSNSNDKLDPSTESIQGNDTVEVGEFEEYVIVPAEDFESVQDNSSTQSGARIISTYQESGESIPGLESFVEYEKVPRDKSKDKVTFSIGDVESQTQNKKSKELIDKIKDGETLSLEEIKHLEDFLPIKVTLSNDNKSASSFIDSMSHPESKRVEVETLPLRKAIVKALIDNKGSFEGIEGSVEKQFPGRLKISDNTRNSIFELDVFKDMDEKARIKYFQNNTAYYNTKGEFVPAKENNDLKGSEPNLSLIDGKKHKGELFLRIPMNNGKDFWLKLNSNKISEEKAISLFLLMKDRLTFEHDVLISDVSDYIAKENEFDFLKAFETEINLIKSNEPLRLNQTLDRLIDLIIFNGNKNSKTKFKIDTINKKVEVGILFAKLSEGITQPEFTAKELEDRKDELLEGFIKFFSAKRHNILFSNGATANFGNSNYIKYLLNEQDPILTTNAVVNEGTFGGYSNIYLNQNVTNSNNSNNTSKEYKPKITVNSTINGMTTIVDENNLGYFNEVEEIQVLTNRNSNSFIVDKNKIKMRIPSADFLGRAGGGTFITVNKPESFNKELFEKEFLKLEHDGFKTTEQSVNKIVKEVKELLSKSSEVKDENINNKASIEKRKQEDINKILKKDVYTKSMIDEIVSKFKQATGITILSENYGNLSDGKIISFSGGINDKDFTKIANQYSDILNVSLTNEQVHLLLNIGMEVHNEVVAKEYPTGLKSISRDKYIEINAKYDAELKALEEHPKVSKSGVEVETEVKPQSKSESINENVELLNPEDIRRPNGSIGTQGFDPSQMKDLVKYMSDLLGLNIPLNLLDKNVDALKPLIEYIKNDSSIKEKIIEYVKTNPSVIRILPDGTIEFVDGNHRANLLNIIGSEVIPVINENNIKSKLNLNSVNQDKQGLKEDLKTTKTVQEIPRENISFFVSGGIGVGHQSFPTNKLTSDYDIRSNLIKLNGFRYLEHSDGSISFHIPYKGLDIRNGSHLGIAIKELNVNQIDEKSVKNIINKLGEELSKISKNITHEERESKIRKIGNNVIDLELKIKPSKTIEVTETNRDSIIKNLNDLKDSNPREYASRVLNIINNSNGELIKRDIKESTEYIIDKLIESNTPIEGKIIKKDC